MGQGEDVPFTLTTNSGAGVPAATNGIARDFTATAPDRRWVGDVTYLRAPQGWAISPVNDHRLALQALNSA